MQTGVEVGVCKRDHEVGLKAYCFYCYLAHALPLLIRVFLPANSDLCCPDAAMILTSSQSCRFVMAKLFTVLLVLEDVQEVVQKLVILLAHCSTCPLFADTKRLPEWLTIHNTHVIGRFRTSIMVVAGLWLHSSFIR